ncbi:MAG: hypothetical protein WA869_34285 [Alloacidobacterium sp.]|jgi:hypothetical protein
MATTFTTEDAKTCFHCGINPPSFRLISLEQFPNDARELEPDCMAGLFCESCLKLEIDNYFQSFTQAKLPLGIDESTESFLSRQVGFVIVPLILSEEESKLLVDEIESDWLECTVN